MLSIDKRKLKKKSRGGTIIRRHLGAAALAPKPRPERDRVAGLDTGGEAGCLSEPSLVAPPPPPPMSSASFLSPPAPQLPCPRARLPHPSAAARASLGFEPRRAAPAKVRHPDHSILLACAYCWFQQYRTCPPSVAWIC